MKKTVILVCSMIFAIVLIPVILVCFAFGLAPQYDKSFYGGMAIKYDRLKSIEDKKIVVIGGSSVAFGLRSDIMEEELKMPVVNFGLYANLGTKYMLDVAKDFIKKGDIVIISPEQNKQALSTYFNAEATWYSADGHYEILTKVGKDNRGELAEKFLLYTSNKFNYWKDNSKPCPEGVYNVDSFNEYGDISYDRPYNTMENGYDESTPISFSQDVIEDKFITYLNDYNKLLKAKGAEVFYSFSPMNVGAIDNELADDGVEKYYDYLTDKLDFAIIGNPLTHLMDEEWFYDSNFHLNNDGAVYYTALLAQELKAELDDFTPVKTEAPAKPEAGGGEGADFEFTEDVAKAAEIFELGGVEIVTDGGKLSLKGSWKINGLTEYGRTLSEVVIPDELAGVAVTAVAAEAFKDDAALTKLTLGKNISSIGLKAFEGCTALRSIYVLSENPDVYHVSSTVLDGLTDCFFYIPASAYIDYKLDYFWGYMAEYLKTYN